jgi:hypothetical protein
MFTGDNVLGHGTSAVGDLGIFINSLEKMNDQGCATGYSAHGCTIEDLPTKIRGELASKQGREWQVLWVLQSVRDKDKSITISSLVGRMYGDGLDEQTRTLALEPFMDEVLRKLAGDGKAAFEERGGVKKCFSLARPSKQEVLMERMRPLNRSAAVKAC